MEIKTQFEVLSNTNNNSNYDRIFENNRLKLDRSIFAIDKLDIHSNKDNKTNYKSKNNRFFEDYALVNDIGYHGLGNRIFLFYQSNQTLSIIDFDILQ